MRESGTNSSSFPYKICQASSIAAARHKIQKNGFNLSNQKLVVLLDENQRLAKSSFEIAAHVIIERFIFAIMAPHLKKSINEAHLKNDTYEQIKSHLGNKLESIGLEASEELQRKTVTQHATKPNRPKKTSRHDLTAKSQATIDINAVS